MNSVPVDPTLPEGFELHGLDCPTCGDFEPLGGDPKCSHRHTLVPVFVRTADYAAAVEANTGADADEALFGPKAARRFADAAEGER